MNPGVPAAVVGPGRQPRQERSRATRQRLLDACIESLADVGWDRTTVVAVASRAGVSRGAAQHHFATRDELVVACVEDIIERIGVDLRSAEHEIHSRDDQPLAVLELLSDLWTGVGGRAAMHLWVAASTDPGLRELIEPMERRLNRELYRATVDLLGADTSRPQVRESVRLALQVMRGMGLGALLRRDPARRTSELAQLAVMLAAVEGVVRRLPL